MRIFKRNIYLKPYLLAFLYKISRTTFIINLLTFLIVLLPITEIFLVTYSTFVDLSNQWRTIRIPAGNHSYYPSVEFVYDLKEIEFYFKTDSSWFYPEPERNGWSKLRGFSKGTHHEGGSARLVYKCINDTMLLVGGYCYVNGVHPNDAEDQQATIDTIQPGQVYHCIIRHEDDKFKFYFEDKYWECGAGDSPAWGYMLNPFIGGVFTLDHDWRIKLLDINRADTTSFKTLQFDSIDRGILTMQGSGPLKPGF